MVQKKRHRRQLTQLVPMPGVLLWSLTFTMSKTTFGSINRIQDLGKSYTWPLS